MARLSSGRELLESAVSYALASGALVTPQLLSRPTPCPGWDLETLLDHLSDSIGVLGEAIATAGVSPGPAQGYDGPGRDPVARLRGQAARLLGACAAAGPAGRRVAIGDRELTASMVAVTGAIEITVHGWDISCRSPRCSSPRAPGLGCSPTPFGCPSQPAPATSSSPSSAASRAPRPRQHTAAPEPGTRLRPARKLWKS